MRWSAKLSSAVFICCLIGGSFLSLTMGAMQLPASESVFVVVDKITGSALNQLADYQQIVVLELRLPRLLLAMLVGAILAQCGAVMQGLFRNPLADPGIIGVSSGAAVGAILAITLLPDSISSWAIPIAAFTAGLGTTLFVYVLARSQHGTSVLVLLLAGVAISAFAGAAIGFMTYFTDDQDLRELSLWQMGSLATATSSQLWLALATLCCLAIAFQRRASALNALLFGESEARHLGIAVESLKLQLIILTAIGVGIAVASSGIIGFIGLVVPHLIRAITGPNHHTLLPLSALCGALLLLIADLAARLVVQPAELPVGLVTALLGAPFFLVLLLQQRKQWA